MTAFNFRSLLLAAIVLSNCITWTASRHHYAHNVHQHRTRHRRQGAGLYLPASYIIPGQEGRSENDGGWGEWGPVSPCSRTCGGGVASQKRICLQIGPDGEPQCQGGDTKYFSCQTQDCPAGSGDFRAEQCAEFNDKEFRGFKYNWVPYTKAPNPCELNCMPHGERFYFRHKLKVTDGTRCNDESFDVCVDGRCQQVGCDMMLGSNAREDKCRECRGNGANCRTTAGIIDSQDLIKGYNDVLLIPEGSTTIIIEEIDASNNYLALRAKNDTYYLNGHYHIDFPRTIMIAGALWTYERSQQGYAAPDKLRCLGPTTEPLYLSLLLQDVNVGIRYEYSVPKDQAPPAHKQYNWVHEEFTPCSATCGGGFQTRNVTCRSREELEIVDDGLCDAGLKPPTNQTCNTDPCPAEWNEGPWGNCSKRCGSGGVRAREVTCQKIIANGIKSIVEETECFERLGPKPKLFESCNEDAPCPTWFVGHWKPCSALCDEGKQTRQVVCYQKKNGRIEVLSDENCVEEKPEVEKTCMLQPCEGIDWVTSDWVGCDNCLSKNRTRTVVCATKDRQVMDDSMCSYHNRPADQEECDKVPECDVQWYATQWSKCSVSCGEGVQTRKVFCGVLNEEAVVILDDDKCKDIPKYKDSKPCTVPKEECPSQWFVGPWGNCTEKCGGGMQYRRVMCFRGDKPASDCNSTKVSEATQFCNTGPCNADHLLPVNSTTAVVTDESVEYCDDEVYPEEGLDEDLSSTTLDMMMSDSPSPSGFAEHESTLEGSGSTPPLEDWTEEGSGETTFSTGTDWTSTDSDYETGSGDMSTTEPPLSSKDTGSTTTTVAMKTDSTTTTIAMPTEPKLRSSIVPSSTSEGTTETGDTDTTGTSTLDGTTATGTYETGPTGTDKDSTASTTEGETGSTTESTETTETDITADSSTTLEDSSSTDTESTDSTVTSETGSTESSVSADTKETESTDESSSPVSASSTDTSGSTPTGETESSGSTRGDIPTDETSSTDADKSTATEETGSTESTTTDVTDTDITDTSYTDTTGTEDTESTVTEETSSTESTVTDTTVTSETESTETETTITGSTNTESTSTDSTEESTTGVSVSGSTDSTTTTVAMPVKTDSTTTTLAMPTEKTSSDASKTSELSTESSGSTVESSTTEESTTDSSSTIEETESTTDGPSTLESESTVESSTASGSEETTEQSTTVSGIESSTVSESESTTAIETSESESTKVESSTLSGTESTTELESISGSSTETTGETTESSTTVGSESTTEAASTTEEESTTETGETTSTEATESTEEVSTTESGSTQESTTGGLSTTEGSTTAGSTEESQSTTEGPTTTEGSSSGTTSWDKTTVLVPRVGPRLCIPRPKKGCKQSKYGCCPDKRTPADGPFDEGCKKPKTCDVSEFKCCPDGLSPALGKNFEGCPIEPCADTLFGCCLSDNKTAAQGNDQEGCPPPPPACASSKFGCCADNETEASGPESEGCPETETTSTEALTETTTDTTESIETSEGSTTTEGASTTETATEYASTTLDPCISFQYGCCGDNQTESPGPDGQGCPCEATEYGCCSDGKTPAQGANDAGCPGPCSTSQHGCCPDGQTPAHGPEFEGCCLLHAFKCCPDNRKPAEGPHLEGCGCQYSRHGCCPNNVTIAQGPGNEGCGCEYSEHGCCPDRHTIALGPNFEGCACHTYQFGCCADGVTIAKGPEQQGCHCYESPFGCCGDGETHATGPEKAGCDCSTSKYGCCPDGVTEATGSKFLGCTDAPENKQASCSLPTDPGSCHDFTAMWYYDMAYGGCSRFWYGGCEGNGNRFATKEDCEDVCVQPAPKDACKLPSVKGACDAEYTRWHYNSTMEQCVQFRYGGCLGNANNFDSRELCAKQCEPTTVEGQCTLPIESGSCAGNYSRWGFNSDTGKCERFTWGGCEGNSNRFSTEAACLLRCLIGAQPPQCTEPQEAGTCTDKQALWSFSVSENRCVPFYYSGCGGNHNKFASREACEQTCPIAYVPDKCTLPAETGECSNYRERWFYDTAIKRCRQFYFGGCGGNANNFGTEAECEGSCAEVRTTTTTTTTARPVPPPPDNPEPAEYCLLEIDAGPCNNTETRYAYDSVRGRCVTFEYGGCGGNQNNFPDYEYCSLFCGSTQDICQLPMLTGPCGDSQVRFFYDPATDSCSQFTYGGCEGNDNRFETREACESRCRSQPAPRPTTLPATTVTPSTTVALDVPAECRSPLETCQHGGVVWYLDPTRNECVSHANQESGSECRHSGTYSSQEACERSCGAFKGVDVCKQRMDPGPCMAYIPKVYFDASTGQCREFAYGGCLGGANRFSSVDECSQVCKSEIQDVCSLPPEEGNCFNYIPQWYYDTARDQCLQFVYTGCSGNDNRFETKSDCESRCKRPAIATTTTTAAPPQQTEESECKTPSSLVPCGVNVTMFYYDSERRQCLVGEIGNCGHPNTYRTEEECERRCGAFVGLDPCGSHLDPGPCRASFPKFYWDSITASCQEYSYGGCDGGPNRFSTVDECESVCNSRRPPRECLQAADTGAACGAAPAARYHYSAALGDCVVFAYLGCGGNGNNFHSYAQCLDYCTPTDATDCSAYRMECEARDCKFGTLQFEQDGCQRCVCKEDPCLRANCSASEHCVVYLNRNPGVPGGEYAAKCIADQNEVFDCEDYNLNCSRLQCEYGVQRTRLPNGCEQCSCVQVEVDCRPLQEECDQLICNYGMDKIPGPDGCERCKCKDYPCATKSCAAGERCVVSQYWEPVNQEMRYSADCHQIVKPGACPMEQTTTNEVTCRRDCKDDADCRGVGKCCRRGCSSVCTEPVEQTSPHPLLTTTFAPNIPAAPQALPAPEPQVDAAEGGKATLRCLFHGNPPPKITWKYGEVTIDGNAGRYRLQSDGALEIVSLYRNDTGVYICVADNGLGVATQEIYLAVTDPVETPVGIAGDENAVVTGELGRPLHVRCLAYGYPEPSVFWYRGLEETMVPYNDAVYEARGNVLLIRSLAVDTLGHYTCQAYNGIGKPASWVVVVRAYRPEGIFSEHELLVPRATLAPGRRTRPPTTAETTTTTITTTTTTEPPRPLFTVPVTANISTNPATMSVGRDLYLICNLDGFPEPEVYWTKDGYPLQSDGRISITGSTIVSRLTVARLTVSDSGLYACHAQNQYSSQTDTVQINVQQQVVVPAKCTDNPFFANCDLIVHSKFCKHKYYSKFCCKSCVEAGQLDPREAELQADQPLRRK